MKPLNVGLNKPGENLLYKMLISYAKGFLV